MTMSSTMREHHVMIEGVRYVSDTGIGDSIV